MFKPMIAASLLEKQQLSSLSTDLLKTLAYFQIFSHPLTEEELFYNMSIKTNLPSLRIHLNELLDKGFVKSYQGYYFLGGDRTIVDRRIKGGVLADKYLSKARKISQWVGQLPFVRGIYISGSLSKGFMDEQGDIDYFVVTKPGKLWLTKGYLMLMKKVFLLNSKKYFCFNYFVDQEHLRIPDQNIFTARELNHLIPTYNASLLDEMLIENHWAIDAMPNSVANWKDQNVPNGVSLRKRVLEFVLGGPIGWCLEKLSMKSYEKFWQYKYKGIVSDSSDVRIRCLPYVSKIHPNNFQERVLNRLQEEISLLEDRFNIRID